MALEFGSGTQADPYLLVNLADVTAWLTTKQTQGYWFALVNDMDLSATTIQVVYADFSWNLDGRGHQLRLKMLSTINGYLLRTGVNCNFKNVMLEIDVLSTYFIAGYQSNFIFSDSVLKVNKVSGGDFNLISGKNGIIISPGGDGAKSGAQNIYKHSPNGSLTINTVTFPDGNPFSRANYPSFTEEKWIFDGISLPRPRPQATADLTTRYGVKGQSKVGGNNRQRNLAVFTANGLRYKVQDTKADGSFFLNMNDVTTPVIVLAYDDIGAKAAINTAYSLNQIIHPATPNGFRYRCTLAGNSGATIPPEPWSTTTVLTIGAAKFTPEPVYEPKAHGPLLPVLFNVITEQPV